MRAQHLNYFGLHPMRFWGLTVLLCWALNLGFWPGMGSHDTRWQWQEALSGHISDWHPPLMAWWWGVLYHHVLSSPGALLLFHVSLFWAAIYVLGRTLGAVSPWLAYLLIAFWFTPSVMSMTIVVWKDVGMVCAYMLAVALLVHAVTADKKLGVGTAFFVFMLLFYGTAVRHNAMVALLPLCVLVAIAALGKVKWQRLLVFTAMLFSLVLSSVHLVNKAITDYHTPQSPMIMLYQLVGMSHYTGKTFVPAAMAERRNMAMDDMLAMTLYNYSSPKVYRIPPLKPGSPEQAQEAQEIKAALWDMLRHYPLEYLGFRAVTFQYVLGLGEGVYRPYEWNEGEYAAPKRAVGEYFKATGQSYWFRAWMYLGAALVLFVAGVRRKNLALSLITLSGILYELAYFFIAPTSDFRFSYWLMMCVFIGLALWARQRRLDAALSLPR